MQEVKALMYAVKRAGKSAVESGQVQVRHDPKPSTARHQSATAVN